MKDIDQIVVCDPAILEHAIEVPRDSEIPFVAVRPQDRDDLGTLLWRAWCSQNYSAVKLIVIRLVRVLMWDPEDPLIVLSTRIDFRLTLAASALVVILVRIQSSELLMRLSNPQTEAKRERYLIRVSA